MHLKHAEGMTAGVGPDQTAPLEAVCSWPGLFAQTYLSQYFEI